MSREESPRSLPIFRRRLVLAVRGRAASGVLVLITAAAVAGGCGGGGGKAASGGHGGSAAAGGSAGPGGQGGGAAGTAGTAGSAGSAGSTGVAGSNGGGAGGAGGAAAAGGAAGSAGRGGLGGGAGGAGGGAQATLFLSHGEKNLIFRYAIGPGQDPVLGAMIPAATPEGLAMSAAGELFAASEDGTVSRFTSPLGAPVANGKLEGLGVTQPEEMAFVDGELWIPSTDYGSCTKTASKITRVAFDALGAGTVAGTLQAPGIVTAGRGVMWDVPNRIFYVSDCTTVDALQPYKVAADHTIVAGPTTTGVGINNPHGMARAPWGELFVSNANAHEVLRFTAGSDGALVPSGKLTENGLSFPIGLAFAPWGELFVVNQGSGTLSRFTFEMADATHAATANGAFATNIETASSTHRLGWLLLVPTPPSSTGPVH